MELHHDAPAQAASALAYLAQEANLRPGDLVVVGCSTSEVLGGEIGKESSPAMGQALCEALMEKAAELKLTLAAQCCEHLNRALVMPRHALESLGLTEVLAVPYPKAGGSLGAAYYRALPDPVLAQSVQAKAGMDIGDTLIGMHLRPVAVPLRGPVSQVGQAHLVMAYARPPLIGGARAQYTLEP